MNSLVRMLFLLGVFVLPGVVRRIHWKPGRSLPSAQVVLSEAVLLTHLVFAIGLFLVGLVGLGVAVELILLSPAWLGWTIAPVAAVALWLGVAQARLVIQGWQVREQRRRERRLRKVAKFGDNAYSETGAGPEVGPNR